MFTDTIKPTIATTKRTIAPAAINKSLLCQVFSFMFFKIYDLVPVFFHMLLMHLISKFNNTSINYFQYENV
ncbi:MAG: hypothetical protein CMO01_10475 [Thalassobius sp.]|nr:hypothetical protein [Thalassovita sp.]